MAPALVAAVFDAVMGLQAEIAIFVIALCTHAVLFGSYHFRPFQAKAKLGPSSRDASAGTCAQRPPQPPAAAPPAPAAPLLRAVRQLLREGASREDVTEELRCQLHAVAAKDVCPTLAAVLESVGRTPCAELLEAVREVLCERGLVPSQQVGDALLKGFLSMRLQEAFAEVLKEVEAAGMATPATAVLALRSSLSCSDLEAAMGYLRRFASPLKASLGVTPSAAPQKLLQQLVELAAHRAAVPALLRELAACDLLTASLVEAAIVECAKSGGGGLGGFIAKGCSAAAAAALAEVEGFVRTKGVELTDRARAVLLRSASGAEGAVRVLTEAAEQGPVGKELLLAAIEAAVVFRAGGLLEGVLRYLPQDPAPEVAVAVLRAVADGPLRRKEADAALLRAYEERLAGVDVLVDARAGRLVAEAALRRRRPEVLGLLLRAAAEPSKQVALIKSFGNEQRLADARAVFQACPDKTACLYNALLDACVDSQDMETAERIMSEAVAAGKADVVTYNTLVKKHLQQGELGRARAVIEAMRAAGGGLAPNAVTFNELIDATIRNSTEGAWVLIEEMKACGMQPTSVTCSILLKSIQRTSKPAEVEKVMAFVDSLGDAMDEVLLSSVCEACIRVGRADLLAKQLQRQRSGCGVPVNGAHTFGSLIRSCGVLKDLDGAWAAWCEMRTRHIMPTSITIGCMVEALVSNGDPEAGYELIRELSADEQTRSLLNAIIYCSVVKGFCHQKCYSRVWDVYEEMVKANLQFSIVTYNALIDACARGGEMARVQPLLEEMARQKIEPNLVTYSTILKGYCQEGRLEKACELLETMKKSQRFRPDEITYNTIIDGCAQRGLYDQGIRLLEEMQQAGVAPSTFTLSVLVKLANRARRPDRAFELVEELSRKYRLQPNVHVYANLVHACTAHGDTRRAVQVLERMVRQRVRPDVRTYTLLLKGCLEAGELQEAACLVRLACGLARGGGAPPAPPARLAGLAAGREAAGLLQLRGGLPQDLIAEVLEALVGRSGEQRLAVQLCKDLRSVVGMKFDSKLSAKVIRAAGLA